MILVSQSDQLFFKFCYNCLVLRYEILTNHFLRIFFKIKEFPLVVLGVINQFVTSVRYPEMGLYVMVRQFVIGVKKSLSPIIRSFALEDGTMLLP